MEDVSYRCLNELVGRCMVQVGKHGSSKKIKTCHLHDLMRDLCMLKAKEENFLRIINYSAALETKETPNRRVRRLAIYLDNMVDTYGLGKETYGHVRSLLYFVPENSKILRSLLKNFTLLRVLKFGDTVAVLVLLSFDFVRQRSEQGWDPWRRLNWKGLAGVVWEGESELELELELGLGLGELGAAVLLSL
ncbi:PREDICTED: disease [Prunus dulcis]|uniref:PREDICTED: disease n=1 Tax=Prunus dulcis TaxID=3755 RepID=A0A5E4FNV3_PRUDU|nr:PREDICTED: disease [Prunus dulcis]